VVKIKNRQQVLIMSAIAIVAILAADRIIINPLSSLWSARSKRIVELRKKVQAGKRLVGRERSLRTHWDEMRTNTLPANPSIAEQQVLSAFNRWSEDSRVTITSISPQWKHDADEYTTLQCRVEASGNLNAVSKFLYNMEKDPMALRLETLEISSYGVVNYLIGTPVLVDFENGAIRNRIAEIAFGGTVKCPIAPFQQSSRWIGGISGFERSCVRYPLPSEARTCVWIFRVLIGEKLDVVVIPGSIAAGNQHLHRRWVFVAVAVDTNNGDAPGAVQIAGEESGAAPNISRSSKGYSEPPYQLFERGAYAKKERNANRGIIVSRQMAIRTSGACNGTYTNHGCVATA